MHRRSLIISSVCWLGVLAYILVIVYQKSTAPTQSEKVIAVAEPVQTEEVIQQAAVDHESDTQAQIEELAVLETKRKQREEAARQMFVARSQLQIAKSNAWHGELTKYSQTIQAMLHHADRSSTETIPCSICDGKGTMPYCILCENTGKCPTCGGKGRVELEKSCPTCRGTGKCYLCSGSGRMACLYCDDGTFSRKVSLPPLYLPVRCDPVPDPQLAAAARDAEIKSTLNTTTTRMAHGSQAVSPPSTGLNYNGLMVVAAVLLGAGLAFKKFVVLHNERYNPWAPLPAVAARVTTQLRSEEKAFSQFLTTFRTGPVAIAGDAPLVAVSSSENEPLAIFFTTAENIVGELTGMLQKINATTKEPDRRTILMDLHRELSSLKGAAGLPKLLPVWQMTAAMEGLVKQLVDKTSNVTPSTLRTVAAGIDLLKKLCVPGLRADLLSNPPIRILAVDDDAISRKAVSMSLKKALNQPDLADHGKAALTLANENAYDVIFLDVQMPGMDGYEVCTKIRETIHNATTPVVFVTILNDFDARAQSILSGGSDLIAKPFLTFEITVKALTYIMRGRLESQSRAKDISQRAGNASTQLPAPAETDLGRSLPNGLKRGAVDSEAVTREVVADDQTAGPAVNRPAFLGKLTREFLIRAPIQLDPLSLLIKQVFETTDELARQKKFLEFGVGFKTLMPQGEIMEEHPALRLGAAIEGLLQKIQQNPKHLTSSSVLTIISALDLLDDLCTRRVKSDMAINPPIHMLAVDDDPIALRVIMSALQMTFEKPTCVESGEAALALATEKQFDAIFMDVQMPGMDGFTACIRIHETVKNAVTPIIFVTSLSDFKARTQGNVSGGKDFITKPFLMAEIKVKALTYVLRGRLQRLTAVQNLMVLPKDQKEHQEDSISVLA